MATSACGINCDICRLNLFEICSSCGPGTSLEAAKKIEVQERLFGRACPILYCANKSRIDYCLRDCSLFPCDNFKAGPYPFSGGFLKMQERRRLEKQPMKSSSGDVIKVPQQYWEELNNRDINRINELAETEEHSSDSIILPFLNEDILIELTSRCIKKQREGKWELIDNSLLELIALVYLLNVGPGTITNQMISVNELKDAHFFQGPHELKTAPVLKRYGNDLAAFKSASATLGGEEFDIADASFKFSPFPKVPLYYLLWEGDEEFSARLSVLFDKSIERHLSADAIYGVVRLVSDALVKGAHLLFA